jgi:RIO-like serine/threonine protein kinase
MMQLLSSSNWVMYNASIARALGKDCAILLGELCSMRNAFNKDEFFVSYERIEERTALNEREIRKAMNILIKSGIIKRKQKVEQGNRWFYRIIESGITEVLKG